MGITQDNFFICIGVSPRNFSKIYLYCPELIKQFEYDDRFKFLAHDIYDFISVVENENKALPENISKLIKKLEGVISPKKLNNIVSTLVF